MRLLLCRNCQVLSVFSLEPSRLGLIVTMLKPGSFEEPVMFASVKEE